MYGSCSNEGFMKAPILYARAKKTIWRNNSLNAHGKTSYIATQEETCLVLLCVSPNKHNHIWLSMKNEGGVHGRILTGESTIVYELPTRKVAALFSYWTYCQVYRFHPLILPFYTNWAFKKSDPDVLCLFQFDLWQKSEILVLVYCKVARLNFAHFWHADEWNLTCLCWGKRSCVRWRIRDRLIVLKVLTSNPTDLPCTVTINKKPNAFKLFSRMWCSSCCLPICGSTSGTLWWRLTQLLNLLSACFP